MKAESVFIVHPTNNDQINALKVIFKAFKMKFEVSTREEHYNPEFVAKIKQGEQDVRDGNITKISSEELKALWK